MEAHDLHHEFPMHYERIHDLKMNESHFRHLFDQYHEVNKEIQRIEQSGVFTDDVLNGFRHRRSQLKDGLFAMLTA
ncbi:MAG: DUF465 domain-containing protein [Sphingomonadales bacterium]|nr:DUF465 domain-containing protein [Sphingomonadales bacterium]